PPIFFFTENIILFKMNTLLQKHRTVRVGIAVIVSLFIVLNGRWDDALNALVTPSFYLAFAISFAVALLLLWYVQYANQVLERWYPWRTAFADRSGSKLHRLLWLLRIAYRGLLQL